MRSGVLRRLIGALGVCAALSVLVAGAASAQQLSSRYPLKAPDGSLVANHDITPNQMVQAAGLPGAFVAGNANGDVTLVQFYDLNCPFCRAAAADVDELIRADRGVKLVFVPYPILSVQSVEGGRVELALHEVAPQRFMEFRGKIYATRGTIDGARSLAVIREMGLDPARVVAAANRPQITDALRAHAALARTLNLLATPSYVVQNVAIIGHPGLATLRGIVRSVRTCRAVTCS